MTSLTVTRSFEPSFRRGWSASDWFGALLVLVQLSALYGFIGMRARLPNAATLSTVTLGLHLIYCGLNVRTIIALIRRWYILIIIVFLWFLPLLIVFLQFLTGLYPTDRFVYWAAYVSFFGTLTMTSLILSYRADPRYITRLILIALSIIAFEFALNVLSYNNVRPILLFIGSPVSVSLQYSRILGFFSHPNEAACAVNLCLFWVLLWRNVRFGAGQLVLIVISASLIIATGSRTSLIVLVLIVAGYLYRTLSTERKGGGKVFLTIATGVPLLTIAIALIMTQPNTQYGMSQRIIQLVGMVSGAGSGDESATLRVIVINKFIDIVLDAPLLGSGFDALSEYVKQGVLPTVSQVAWLQWAGEYGILYPLFGAFVLVSVFARARRAQRRSHAERKAGGALAFLIGILFVYSLSLVDIFMIRSIVVVLGLSVGALARAVDRSHHERLDKRGAMA
jgi:hypothetical protein